MIYAFEGYTLDTGLFELRRGNDPIPVEPQVFELLALLVTAHERVVTREEIFEKIWKNRIVSDTALSSRIKEARRAVGDDGAAQRLIRTIRGRGLRFVGEVRPVEAAGPEEVVRDVAKRVDDLTSNLLERPAIAVLPFADTTGAGEAIYLADGVTDEVIAALCAWRYFPVISRNSAFRYRDTSLSAREIGREIGARYLLTGTLQRGRDQVRLKADLTDAEEDRQIWSGRVVCRPDEMFRLDEDLAQQVVGMLEPEMRGAEVRRILRKSSEDMTAWDLTMRANWRAHRSDETDLREAEALAREAADLAPDWYMPYATIAFVKFQHAMRSFSASDARTAFADTLNAARKALEIDSGSWLAHALVGVGELWTNLHYERALNHIHRAIELNPSACQVYHFGGCIIGFSGDPDVALRHQQRIFRIDPAYPYAAVIEADLGLWNMVLGNLDTAEEHFNRAIQWDPGYGRAYQRQVALYGLKGDWTGSERAIAKLGEIGIPINRDQLITSYPFRRQDHRDVFFDGLRRAGVNL